MSNDLRYEISDWHQLPQCKSNTSRQLSIKVSDILNDDRLSAVRITVYHESFGDLYTVLINPQGTIMYDTFEIDTQKVLNDLSCFGFLVQFSQRKHLSGNMIQKLMTLNTMGFDKIRRLLVLDRKTNQKSICIVAFMINKLPDWIYNDYESDTVELTCALQNGSALNLSALSYFQNLNWSWLDYVASIDDVLRDNQ